eukprot:2564624-Amphidinium_carterae.2
MPLGTAQLLGTRALTKPPRFSGNDEDWKEWNFQFWGYAGLLSQTMHTQVRAASRIPQPLHVIYALEDTLATRSRNVYAVPDQHGYEAWRRLCAQREPTTSFRIAGMLQALISPDFKADSLESWESSWPQWEEEVFCYGRKSGKSSPTEMRVFVVLNRAPTAIAAQPQTQAVEFEENYDRLREVLRTCKETARRYRGGGQPKFKSQYQERAPMEPGCRLPLERKRKRRKTKGQRQRQRQRERKDRWKRERQTTDSGNVRSFAGRVAAADISPKPFPANQER